MWHISRLASREGTEGEIIRRSLGSFKGKFQTMNYGLNGSESRVHFAEIELSSVDAVSSKTLSALNHLDYMITA